MQRADAPQEARPLSRIFADNTVRLAVLAMVIGQLVMTLIMVITPLHMKYHQHDTQAISWVIMEHTLGMFGLSSVTGWMIDAVGRVPMIVVGALVLVMAGVLAPVAGTVWLLAVALFLLGLGWNFCFVGGSTLLADQLSPAERGRTQGRNDLFVGLASATSVLSSGLIFNATSYTFIALLAGALSLIPLFIVLNWMRREQAPASVRFLPPSD